MNGTLIYYDRQKFAGWPANAGMWSWGNEVLVAFHVGAYLHKRTGHSLDQRKGVHTMLARSLNGGQTWQVEANNPLDEMSTREPIALPEEGIRFAHPDFALKVGRASVEISNPCFLVTYDRGHTWQGPYLLPEGDASMTARTDYVIDGQSACTLILSRKTKGVQCKSHPDRAYAVHTDDGGRSWNFLGYLADKGARSALTNTVRMSDGSLICSISRRNDMGDEDASGTRGKAGHSNHWIELRRSTDGGRRWRVLSRLDMPYNPRSKSSNPSCLGRLPDGRLVIHYAFRGKDPRIVARISQNGGRAWSDEIVLDNDVVSDDIGYPKLAMLPFGSVLVVYHTATRERPQQHIKCIRWQP